VPGSGLGHPPAALVLAQEEATDLLIGAASRGRPIEYGQVVERLKHATFVAQFHGMLGAISRRTFEEDGLLLSAVVVRKDSRRPGTGFYKLARDLGFEFGLAATEAETFWAEHLLAVHERWLS